MESCYMVETSSFILDVLFVDAILKITLIDFLDGINYYRQYTAEDIGKQINRRVDLENLFYSLAQTQKQKGGNETDIAISDYEFGQIVKWEKSNCYKVDKGGVLTIYVALEDKRANKEIILKSELHLQVKSKLTDLEMQKHKITVKKKKEDNKYIMLQVEELKKDNQKIRNQLKEIKQILVGKPTRTTQSKDQQKQLIKNSKWNELIDLGFLTSLLQVNLASFHFSGTVIQYVKNGEWNQLIFNQYIPFNEIFVFKIKIMRTSRKNLMIGVVDYMRQKDKKTSYNSKNSICFYTLAKGQIFSSSGQKTLSYEKGVNQGQTIEVEISRANQKISWSIEGKQIASINDNILSDKSRIFLPYIEMYDQKDIIEYIPK